MFCKFQISNRLPNRYFPKIVVGCPCSIPHKTTHKTGFPRYNIFSSYFIETIYGRVFFSVFTLKYACIITQKSRASIRGIVNHFQTAKKIVIKLCVHFSHHHNKPHAHHETHLHIMKVVTILIPSFQGLRQELLGVWPTICGHTKRKETPVFQSLALLKQARLIDSFSAMVRYKWHFLACMKF